MKYRINYGKLAGLGLLGIVIGGLALVCVTAFMVCKEVIPENMADLVCLVAMELLSLGVIYLTVRKIPKKRFPAAMWLILSVILLRLIIGFTFPTGERVIWERCLLSLAAGLLGGLLAGGKKQTRR